MKRNSGVKRAGERERVTEFGSLIFFCGDNDKLQGFSDDNHVKFKKKMVIKVLLKMNVACTAFIMGAAAAATCMSVLLITTLRTTQLAVIDYVLA